VLIPEKCKTDEMIYFEAELPKHGLKGESNSIPVRPPIKVSKLQWDRKEVKRKDEVTLTCQFESGVEEDDDATMNIYEHNPNSSDIKVIGIPTVIKDNKIEMLWEFDYQDDTLLIPTDKDMQPYKKNYFNPDFFFVVVVDGVEIGDKMESGLMKFKDETKITLNAWPDHPLANTEFTLELPDGTQISGRTDSEGAAIVQNIPPGKAKISVIGMDEVFSFEPDKGTMT
jgi:hypothetical protein